MSAHTGGFFESLHGLGTPILFNHCSTHQPHKQALDGTALPVVAHDGYIPLVVEATGFPRSCRRHSVSASNQHSVRLLALNNSISKGLVLRWSRYMGWTYRG
jgi:hypothetical protein